MSDFKQRLGEETTQLSDRLDKLRSFIGTDSFSKINPEQQALLSIQADAMQTYLTILRTRIALLVTEPA